MGNKFYSIIFAINTRNFSLQSNLYKFKQDLQYSFRRRKLKMTEKTFNETSYYFENGLRRVYPYYFNYQSFAKGCWLGRTILDVASSEFRSRPEEELIGLINNGSFTINDEKVGPDYLIKNNDFVSHAVHRHEAAISNKPIQIVHMNDDVLVINKPSSIPVHPCGQYNYNTAQIILLKEFNLDSSGLTHRIDRLTSGLVIFGRNYTSKKNISYQFEKKQISKLYLCRVEGEFPRGLQDCQESIRTISRRFGLCRICPNGKKCHTQFERLSYNGESSLLLCRPLTGRMHQIRVHLQFLGFPIINDVLYNNPAFGSFKGKGGSHLSDKQLIDNVSQNYKESLEQDSSTSNSIYNYNELVQSPRLNHPILSDPKDYVFKPHLIIKDPNCKECKLKRLDRKEPLMYLHALSYSGPGWQYETEFPDWAENNWKVPSQYLYI